MGGVAIAIDAGSLGYWETRRFARGWSQFVEGSTTLRIPFAVHVIASGYFRELVPWTDSAEALRSASDGALSRLFRSSPPRTSKATVGSLEQLALLCDSLAQRQGRKALVWISPGVSLLRSGGDFLLPDGKALELMRELGRRASAASVSIYAVDPTLVTTRYTNARWSRITSREGPVDAIQRDPIERRTFLAFDAPKDSLVEVSRKTGGRSYVFEPNILRALQDIVEDASRFYVLSYVPSRPTADGRYHEIKVTVRRAGVDVRARAGYLDSAQKVFD
jgi:VWFA-related protein